MNVLEMTTGREGTTVHEASTRTQSPRIIGTGCWQKNNLKPNTKYACVMVEIPEGYRLATKEDKEGKKPCPYAILDMNGPEIISGGFVKEWLYETLYAVPEKTEQDRKRDKIEQKIKDAEAKLQEARSELKQL